MSYLCEIEYEIILKDSFWVARNCPKCGRKTHYITTKKFRINANGNKLDVWLIYQCAECKHTLNLDIYRRQKVSSISKEEYQCFLDNKEQLAEMYGKNIRLFQRNKAEIDYEKLYYDYVKLPETMEYNPVDQITVVINNPYQLKIRPEKQIAEVLGLSRSKAKGLLEKGQIVLEPERLRFNCPSN